MKDFRASVCGLLAVISAVGCGGYTSDLSDISPEMLRAIRLSEPFSGCDSVFQHGFQLGEEDILVGFSEAVYDQRTHTITVRGIIRDKVGDAISGAVLAFGKPRQDSLRLRLQNPRRWYADSLGFFSIVETIGGEDVLIVCSPFFIAQVFEIGKLVGDSSMHKR